MDSADRKGSALIPRVGACQNRKSRATFSGQALTGTVTATLVQEVMGERSVLTGMMLQSDKSVSRETFWYD
jgi:hypothetical protein